VEKILSHSSQSSIIAPSGNILGREEPAAIVHPNLAIAPQWAPDSAIHGTQKKHPANGERTPHFA